MKNDTKKTVTVDNNVFEQFTMIFISIIAISDVISWDIYYIFI